MDGSSSAMLVEEEPCCEDMKLFPNLIVSTVMDEPETGEEWVSGIEEEDTCAPNEGVNCICGKPFSSIEACHRHQRREECSYRGNKASASTGNEGNTVTSDAGETKRRRSLLKRKRQGGTSVSARRVKPRVLGGRRASFQEVTGRRRLLRKKRNDKTMGATPKGSKAEEVPNTAEAAASGNQDTPIKRWRRSYVTCPECPTVLHDKKSLLVHVAQHGRKLKYRCTLCDYASKRPDYMEKHKKVHAKGKEREAVVKSLVARAAPSSATRQLPARASKNPPSSTSSTQGSRSLDSSLLSSTTDATTRKRNSSGMSLEWCPKCPTPFAGRKALDLHLKQHGRKFKYFCKYCDYSCKRLDYKENHDRLHAEAAHGKTTNEAGTYLSPPVAQVASPQVGMTECTASPAANITGCSSPDDSVVLRSKISEIRSLNLTPLLTFAEISGDITSEVDPIGVENTKEFLIKKVKIRNIFAITKVDKDADLSECAIAKVQGKGKSSFICAILLGLGYDRVIEHQGVVCGLNIENTVSTGKEAGVIELTLNTRGFRTLENKYGNEIVLQRCKNSQEDVLTLFSADNPAIREQLSSSEQILSLLGNFGFTKTLMRFMLLNEENLDYFINKDEKAWFDMFEEQVELRKAQVEQHLKELKYTLQRLKIMEKNAETTLKCQEELSELELEGWEEISEQDSEKAEACRQEMELIKAKIKSLVKKVTAIENEASSETAIQKVEKRFRTFLTSIGSSGDLCISAASRKIAVCLRPANRKDTPLASVNEINAHWKLMSQDEKRLAVAAYFIGIWDMSCQLIFFADTYCDSPRGFKLANAGNANLFNILFKKGAQGKQGFVSLPPT